MRKDERAREGQASDLELSETDVLAAMQAIPGYIDKSLRDIKDIYR